MKTNDEQRALLLLETLYELARGDVPADLPALTEWSGLDPETVRALLGRLDAQQLVCAETCRLTMQGLVLAVSLCGSRKVAKDAA